MNDRSRTDLGDLIARLDSATKRADRGDEKALAVVAKVFDAFPSLWDGYGNLACAAENALVELWAGDSVLTREGLRRQLAELRMKLGAPDATPVERLMAERVVACWLLSYHADFAYARALRELPAKEAELYQRRQDRAARQYLKALRSLAVVRRLLVPTLQVNIAKRQVNIASAEHPEIISTGRGRRSAGKPRRVGPEDDVIGVPVART